MLKKFLPVIPLAAYVVLFWWWASLGYPTETQICNPPGNAENCESHNVLFAFVVVALDKLNFYSALITALATGAIGYFTLTLKRSTDKLWDAGERQLAQSQENSERQLRAYIHVSEAKFINLGFPMAEFMVHFVNTGQTPAHNVFATIGIDLTDFPLTKELDAGAGGGTKGITNLGRDGVGHARIDSPRGLTGEEYAAVRDGKMAIFVFGKITYRDVFDREWETYYHCYVGGDQGIRRDGSLANHSEGNRAT
jgi:hypothetical protein